MEVIRIARFKTEVRYLFRMLIMIIAGSLWFLLVFIAYIFMLGFMFMALREKPYTDFLEEWMAAYQLSLGEYEDDYLGGYEKFVFLIATVFL